MTQKFMEKYKDIVLFGVCDVQITGVNITTYWVAAHLPGLSAMASTVFE